MTTNMNEKTNLLPSAPDFSGVVTSDPQIINPGQTGLYPQYRLVLAPGLEFDASRKYRYGLNALMAAFFLLIAFFLVELRDCNWSPGIDLQTLQRLHIALMIAAPALYVLSLFGIADFAFRYKWLFYSGFVCVLAILGLMIYTTYEAAVNPCVRTYTNIPLDFTFSEYKNVFSRNDVIGIIVLFADIIATVLFAKAAHGFFKRY